MTLEDIPSAVEIERESHLEPWSKDSFLEEVKRVGSHVFVAGLPEKSTAILGYICFWIVADEIQILNLTVKKDQRRRGIGRRLLLHTLELGGTLRARSATLEVRRSNLAAQQLYKSVGFRAVGERPDYYGGVKEPAILMQLDLGQITGDRKFTEDVFNE
jgi:ribosomal-protein-alanine N-acetyltransferase